MCAPQIGILVINNITATFWEQEHPPLYAFGCCYVVLLAREFLVYHL